MNGKNNGMSFDLSDIDTELDDIDFDSDFDDLIDDEDDEVIDLGSDADLSDLEELDTSDNSVDSNLLSDLDELDSDNSFDTLDDNIDYSSGTPVSQDELMKEDELDVLDVNDPDIVSMSGDFVVQYNTNLDTAFELKVIDIDNIAITNRVRQNASADDITRSIKSTGLLMPIVVAPTQTEGIYVLIDGWRRLMGCARSGKRKVPVIINHNVSTKDIPILESMYNHARKYTIKEMIGHIEYLEVEKGIMNPSMIEYLLQMNSGDYTKLKDILNDNDEDITEKLYSGVWDIETAFRKLEQRRKKESLEEKENKKAAAVYDDEEESGADQIAGAGEEVDGESLTDEQISELMLNAADLDDGLEDMSLEEMIEEDKKIDGFEPHKQKVGQREHIDPAIRKAVMVRDNGTCQCCKHGGTHYEGVLDYHHCLPVFLGGPDTVDNGIMLCVTCHRFVHLYSTGDLHIASALLESNYDDLDENLKAQYPNAEVFEDEKMRMKRVIKLGSVIRKGMAAKGINREKYKKEHSNEGIGRRKPGINAEQEKS